MCMMNWFLRLLIKDYENTTDPVVRGMYGRVSSLVGILCNLLLFTAKIVIGTLANSIAITADAVNNLSDAGSSVITLIGFKLSAKPADKEHPYGHARIEYISGFIISIIIFLLGLELIRSSVDKIIHPEPILYNGVVIAVLVLAVAAKLWLGLFYKRVGARINSTALAAASADSLNDVLATGAVLIATVFAGLTGIQIDGFMGLGVALFIIISGVGLIRKTLSPLLGEAPDEDLVKKIEDKIKSYEGVIGFHDLVIHNYGPDRCFATVHVEMPAERDSLESHEIIDNIEKDFSTEMNIHMVIHMDPVVTGDEQLNQLKAVVEGIVRDIDPGLSMHDFRAVLGKQHSKLIFEVTVPPSFKADNEDLTYRICRAIRCHNPLYDSVITIDRNYISSTHEERAGQGDGTIR